MATTLTESGTVYEPSKWEHVSCPFCGEIKFKPHEKYGPNHRYTYVQCYNCKLVYANPRPVYDSNFVETAYEEYDVQNHHFINGSLNTAEREVVDRNKITLRQIERILGRKGKLLDLGCCSGLFLKAALEENWSCEGIDISLKMTKKVGEWLSIKTRCGQYHELPIAADEKFDVIYCSHVIEHIPNPNEWMKKFAQDLKPNGLLCLNVPNQFSIDRVIKRGLKRIKLKKDKWEHWRTPDHLYEPHLTSMAWLLRKHQFDVIDSFTYSSRETDALSWLSTLQHRKAKLGSKLRIFARPVQKTS